MLQRLRPVRLAIVARELRSTWRLCQALGLVEQFFPNSLLAFEPKRDSWDDILGDFLHLIEAQEWFEIDWERLDDLYNWAMQDYREDGLEPDGEWYLAEYLVGIPVMTFGWGDDRLMNEDEQVWAPLLAGLLTDKINISASLLCDLEIYDALDGILRNDLWRRLEDGHFEQYIEPLCWLPDVARIVCGLTGNDILDSSTDLWDYDAARWTWANDVDEVRQLWTEATPMIQKYRQFRDWVNEDDRRLVQMVEALVGWDEMSDEDEDE